MTGACPPALPPEAIPRHVAVVMDGNGRWANARGLPRTEGHRAGEEALVEVVAGALEIGVEWVSAYAFSTENWRRSPSEVRFLMGYSRKVLRARRDLFHSWGVRIVWTGSEQRLWPSVVRELREAAELTADNTRATLNLCVNYGGRGEIAEAASAIVRTQGEGRISEEELGRALGAETAGGRRVEIPDVDLFWRTSGEQRLSNFLIWESAYAELVFTSTLWPDVDRRDLWAAIEEYAGRARRFGAATEEPKG
ncbi:MAG: polyprenyl diphosphate synthase [Micrococcales bacterium]|nr:polyprenyl diphosphate synthase [Micrococcales bacterium]